MHVVKRFDESTMDEPTGYAEHSEGYSRASLADHSIADCVHMAVGICELAPGGTLRPHVHSYEEGFYILEGTVLTTIDGRNHRFGPGDYGIAPMGALHAWRNDGLEPVRWLDMLSPQPRPPDHPEADTFFLPAGNVPEYGEPADLQDPLSRHVGHFDESQLPPPAQLQMDGYRGGNVDGVSIKMMVDRLLDAQHVTMFIVQFQPGGQGNEHDHPFEESYFFLQGEAEAVLDGQRYRVKAGDFVWTSVGGTHGFFNTGDIPVRWLETQSPQPPDQQGFRFNANWHYLANKWGRK